VVGTILSGDHFWNYSCCKPGKISGGKNPSANTGTKNISVGNEAVTTQKRRVRHPKYGTGSVVREDDMMITVDFDDYGEKELMKMFGGLEELP
jgi:DNA helicase II / ATP-dependent DNA helicase PcrA